VVCSRAKDEKISKKINVGASSILRGD